VTETRPRPRRATYRVQLHARFTLADAAGVVPYLARLGISHLYCSPILQAVPGSTHGYDVVDHGRVNAELGGEDAFMRLTDTLRAHGMGLVLDIVPNHMAITEQNRWWWDVLEHGQASRYARWFDVDWDPPESRLRNVILLPVLPDHYGRVLEAGRIELVREGGRVLVRHGDRRFPLDPRSLAPIVADAAARLGSDELAFIGGALGDLPASTEPDRDAAARRQRDAEVLAGRLDELVAAPEIGHGLDEAIAAVARDVDRLDGLLEQQNYRLALWRAASRDLGYRRFFDVDELIGLRMEEPDVFEETHRLVLGWVGDGLVDGLRVDHPDGLRDPAAYFRRLRQAAPRAWIVAEKILQPDEPLPVEWPIDGTTGYRFANLATGVLVDRAAEGAFSDLWASAADADPAWNVVEHDARTEVLTSVLGSDLNRLTDLFVAVCEANRRFRDFTRHELHDALREVAARLPVYRTYATLRPRRMSEGDRAIVSETVTAAAEARADLDDELFELLGAVLRLEAEGPLAGELAMRFQQLTPAAMAKGVEDTAFYRHHRLVALNEVGGDPGRFGTPVAAFHAAMDDAQRSWPGAMLALSTHDTKRSADLRARLAVLTRDPAAWAAAVDRLRAAAAPHRRHAEAPTEADAYLFFQTAVGAWPIDADRATAYMEKASREAKLRTSWTSPDPAYDEALAAFVRGCLGDQRFAAEVAAVVEGVTPAWQAAAVGQLALELTAPGVPDLYQGSELWELTVVDPDNRRPVDYGLRERLLAEAGSLDAGAAWARRDEGVAKLWLACRLLDLRRRRPASFAAHAAYAPLATAGVAIAYTRGDEVAVVVPLADAADATVELPAGTWRNVDGSLHADAVALRDLVARFPVAVLERAS